MSRTTTFISLAVSLAILLTGSSASGSPAIAIDPTLITGTPGQPVQIDVYISTAGQNMSFAEFIVEYDSTVARFVSADIGADLDAQGFVIKSVNPNLSGDPIQPGTNDNVLVQIWGGATGSFTGEDLSAAVLTFDMEQGCDTTPLHFDPRSASSNLTTYDLQKVAVPDLQLSGGALASNCATDTDRLPGARVELAQNVPNPFNPATVIRFQVPRTSNVSLRVFDPRGRHLRSLLVGEVSAGWTHVVWDGQDETGRQVPSGKYYYQLKTDSDVRVRSMLLLK